MQIHKHGALNTHLLRRGDGGRRREGDTRDRCDAPRSPRRSRILSLRPQLLTSVEQGKATWHEARQELRQGHTPLTNKQTQTHRSDPRSRRSGEAGRRSRWRLGSSPLHHTLAALKVYEMMLLQHYVKYKLDMQDGLGSQNFIPFIELSCLQRIFSSSSSILRANLPTACRGRLHVECPVFRIFMFCQR